ncbi:MAG: Cys-rich protein [Leptospiraceae bacterium]|nr:Cys-rich protein [Leptospiraceae bacterium]MCP5501183.1 Cys-rich protein [Leptospiraceae bacterium]
MKKLLTLSFAFLLSFSLFSGISAQESCDSICNFYKSCVTAQFKGVSEQQLKAFDEGCKKGCLKHNTAASTCYIKNKNKCSNFHSCLTKAYKGNSK